MSLLTIVLFHVLAGRCFMSTDALLSPGFSDWNSVFVKYCDGSSFTGANATAAIVNGTRIYYRGATMYVLPNSAQSNNVFIRVTLAAFFPLRFSTSVASE